MKAKLEAALAESDSDEILRIGVVYDNVREAYRVWSAWAIERFTQLHMAALSMEKLIDVQNLQMKVKDEEIARLRVDKDSLVRDKNSLYRVVDDFQKQAPQDKLEDRLAQLREASETADGTARRADERLALEERLLKNLVEQAREDGITEAVNILMASADLDVDRQALARDRVQLDEDRLVLEAERLRFEHEKRSWDKQVLARNSCLVDQLQATMEHLRLWDPRLDRSSPAQPGE